MIKPQSMKGYDPFYFCLTDRNFASLGTISIWIVTFLIFLFHSLTCEAGKIVRVWTYYDFPPFVVAKNQGLVYDFFELLSQRAEGTFSFDISVLPRKRIDRLLSNGEQGIVPFVHWSYMLDASKTRYFWSPILMADQNELISLLTRKVNFDGTAASLKGLRFGGVLGRQYPQLKDAMQRGDIFRVDTAGGEFSSIKMLLRGRVDVTTVPKSTLKYYSNRMLLERFIYVSPIPRSRYTRHLLMTKGLKDTHLILSQLVSKVIVTDEWKGLLKRYGY